MNSYYEVYQNKCKELDILFHGELDKAKKLRGALAVEILKQEIDNYCSQQAVPVKCSAVNSYIVGSKYEYDLLLIKADAKSFCNLIYSPEDVVAIIESKAGGLFDVDKNTQDIANAVNCACELNKDIRFGYITLSENVPKNDFSLSGKPTVKHWELTNKFFEERIRANDYVSYAVTLHQGKEICDEGSDSEFTEFIDIIVGRSNKSKDNAL